MSQRFTATQANATTKTSQRACLAKRTADSNDAAKMKEK